MKEQKYGSYVSGVSPAVCSKAQFVAAQRASQSTDQACSTHVEEYHADFSRFRTDLAALDPYLHDLRPIFPSTACLKSIFVFFLYFVIVAKL